MPARKTPTERVTDQIRQTERRLRDELPRLRGLAAKIVNDLADRLHADAESLRLLAPRDEEE